MKKLICFLLGHKFPEQNTIKDAICERCHVFNLALMDPESEWSE